MRTHPRLVFDSLDSGGGGVAPKKSHRQEDTSSGAVIRPFHPEGMPILIGERAPAILRSGPPVRRAPELRRDREDGQGHASCRATADSGSGRHGFRDRNREATASDSDAPRRYTF